VIQINEVAKIWNGRWVELIGEVFDILTGKRVFETYTFDNLIIDIPMAEGPDGQNVRSAQWTINGITTKVLEKSNLVKSNQSRLHRAQQI